MLKLDHKPHERSRSAKELAWVFANEEKVAFTGVFSGELKFEEIPAPATMKEALAIYEKAHKENVERVKKMPDAELNKMMKMHVGPKKTADFRKIDILWMFLMDMIHHRGQFSVYLRLVDAKVPSIYGPSADDPW